jgi:antitoxin component YwqK of YwqJK toxin-antitoxin module
MRYSKLLLLTITGFLIMSFATQETIWLDENLQKTTQSKAVYYKIGEALKGEVIYYYKSRSVFRKVYYNKEKLDGKFYEYYNSGELKEVGKYENGHKEGNWRVYYKNGKIKEKGRYNKGERVGVWKIFYKNI